MRSLNDVGPCRPSMISHDIFTEQLFKIAEMLQTGRLTYAGGGMMIDNTEDGLEMSGQLFLKIGNINA